MSDNCAFCDRSKFEERIIAEDDHFYLIATLGQISDGGYVLIVPKRHVPCLGALEAEEVKLLEFFLARIQPALSAEYGHDWTVFEHGIVGQTVKHAHLHFVPACACLTKKIGADFPDSPIVYIEDYEVLRKLYSRNPEPYLLWQDMGGMLRICWNPPARPQYLRILVADALGRPERANWRDMYPVLDRELYSATVARLKPHLS